MQFITLKRGQNYGVLFDRTELLPPLTTETGKEAFREKLFSAQGAIEEALKKKWNPDDDFSVGWDFDDSYSLHGGIYSPRIFCSEYAATVASALESVEDSDRWAYHTTCEIEINPDGKTAAESMEDRGAFYITSEAAYILEDEMKREFREMLGAKD